MNEIETIRIGFELNGEEIMHIVLCSQPFKVGEYVRLRVENKDKSKWDVTEIEEDFFIRKITSHVSLSYVSRTHQYVNFTIEVTKP